MFASAYCMPDDKAFDADRTMSVLQPTVDPEDCATMVTREVVAKEQHTSQYKRTVEALERRIKTIDRIIGALRK
jgi:hypothetical protein